MTIVIREFRCGDETGICEAHVKSVRKICSKDYSPKQIEDWVGHRQPQSYLDVIARGEHFWVADDNGKIAGFSSWFDKEILGFYMHPDYAGRGLGKQLFKVTENDFRYKTGLHECLIVSTLTAKSFYERMGFEAVRIYERDFKNGGRCKVWDMVKHYGADHKR